MINRLVIALVVAVAAGLGCLLLGVILVQLKVPIAVTIGAFLESWGWVIGVLAGLWQFFAGSITFPGSGRKPGAPIA